MIARVEVLRCVTTQCSKIIAVAGEDEEVLKPSPVANISKKASSSDERQKEIYNYSHFAN